MIEFEPGTISLGLDILPIFHRRMTIGAAGWAALVKAHDLGFTTIRVSLTDQDDMPYERYNDSFWSWFESRLDRLSLIGFTPIISVGGYYNRNKDRLSLTERKDVTERAVDIANRVCGEHEFMVEIANEPGIAPRWWRQSDNGDPGDMYSVLGRYLGEVARWCVLRGVWPRHIMTPGGWGDERTYSQWYDKVCHENVAKAVGAPKQNIIRTWHCYHFPENRPLVTESVKPKVSHWSNDGRSRMPEKVGHGHAIPGGFYRSTNAAEFCDAMKQAYTIAKQWNSHIIVADLPREHFIKKVGAFWHFDVSKLDMERLRKISDCYYNLIVGDDGDESPDPEPEPQPEPQPEHEIGFWTKIWNAIRNFFNGLFGG